MAESLLGGLKVALIHDWLNKKSGGEKCLEVLCELFPNADLYTLIHEKGHLSATIESMPIHTSFIQNLPFAIKNYRHYRPFFPAAIERFDLSQYDLIVSSSQCVAKAVKHNDFIYHVSYLYTPMNYVWDYFADNFRQPRTSIFVRLGAELMRPFLQRWDKRTAQNVDSFLCISHNIRRKVLKYYGRESQVIYPPVDLSYFSAGGKKENYYLMVASFSPNERIDIAVAAFNRLKLPLKIVGSGQDEEYCRHIAGETIEFLGQVEDEKLRTLYQNARAFVLSGEDEFGIPTLEAQACHTPVIAFKAGSATEFINEQTGLFFEKQTVNDLCDAIENMEKKHQEFIAEAFQNQTESFSKERYKQEMAHAIEFGYRQWRGGI